MVSIGVCNTRGVIKSKKYAYSDHLFVMASTDVRSKDSILLKEIVWLDVDHHGFIENRLHY